MRGVKKSNAILLCLCLILAVTACKKQPEPETRDEFFEKWRIMAEQSQGHSPTHKPQKLVVEDTSVEEPEVFAPEDKDEKLLPKDRVSLKFHEADLVAVLLSLARAADLSIMVSPGIRTGGADGAVKETIKINVNIVNVPWDQAFKGLLRTYGLTWSWEGDILRVKTLSDMERDLKIQKAVQTELSQSQETKQVEPLVTSILKMRYAKAEKLQENFAQFLTRDKDGKGRGSVVVDTETNSLIVQAIRTDVERMIRLANRLDRPRRQIKLKAYIVETNSDTARALGVQWGGLLAEGVGNGETLYGIPGGSEGTTDDDGNVTYTPKLGSGVSGQGFGLNFPGLGVPSETTGAGAALGLMYGTIGGSILEVQLSALQEANKLKILSSPSITTLDNEVAYTENGESVPYETTDENGQREVEFKDAVLRLEIQPQIIDDEYLRMKILIKKDEVDFTRQVQGNPLIIKKQTETTLITKDRETVVISGLTKSTGRENKYGLPYAKDTPILGWFFRGEGKSHDKEEVLIFITPTVLTEWQPGEVQRTMQDIEETVRKDIEAEQKASEEF